MMELDSVKVRTLFERARLQLDRVEAAVLNLDNSGQLKS